MQVTPRFTIISYLGNGTEHLGEHLASIRNQQYPNFEHIIVIGSATNRVKTLLSEPGDTSIVELPDPSVLAALPIAHKKATGELLCLLQPNDLLLPDALNRAAEAWQGLGQPDAFGGRCRLLDTVDRDIGIEYSPPTKGIKYLWSIWNGFTLPYPSLFWKRAIGAKAISLPPSRPWDYVWLCQLASIAKIHGVDCLFSYHRQDDDAPTMLDNPEIFTSEAISISKSHWVNLPLARRFPLAISLLNYSLDRRSKSLEHVAHAASEQQRHKILKGLYQLVLASCLAPEVVFHKALYPLLRQFIASRAGRLPICQRLIRAEQTKQLLAQGQAKIWSDGWVGPRLTYECPGTPTKLSICGRIDFQSIKKPITLTVRSGDRIIESKTFKEAGDFSWDVKLDCAGSIDICSDKWFTPNGEDIRPLSWRATKIATTPQ